MVLRDASASKNCLYWAQITPPLARNLDNSLFEFLARKEISFFSRCLKLRENDNGSGTWLHGLQQFSVAGSFVPLQSERVDSRATNHLEVEP